MPARTHVVERLRVSAAEHRALLEQRRLALDDATCIATLEGPLPVRWRVGWSATLEILKRDSDGSLCARITVLGPGLTRPYVRRVRLCKMHPSTRGSGSGVARG
jgi:hypothetical protein